MKLVFATSNDNYFSVSAIALINHRPYFLQVEVSHAANVAFLVLAAFTGDELAIRLVEAPDPSTRPQQHTLCRMFLMWSGLLEQAVFYNDISNGVDILGRVRGVKTPVAPVAFFLQPLEQLGRMRPTVKPPWVVVVAWWSFRHADPGQFHVSSSTRLQAEGPILDEMYQNDSLNQ